MKHVAVWASVLNFWITAVGAETIFDGYVEPYRSTDLAAAEPGVVSELRVEEGQAVEKGEIVARLDVAVLEAALRIAEIKASNGGFVAAREAELALRRDRHRKLAELAKQGNANADEVQRAEMEMNVAAANLAIAKAETEVNAVEVERTRAQIERRTLRSPVDGVVAHIGVEVGENASTTARDEGLIEIVQLDRLRANFFVPPGIASQLNEGDTAIIRLPESNATAKGFVEFVAPGADAASGTVRVKVLIGNAGLKYRSGLRCQLVLD